MSPACGLPWKSQYAGLLEGLNWGPLMGELNWGPLMGELNWGPLKGEFGGWGLNCVKVVGSWRLSGSELVCWESRLTQGGWPHLQMCLYYRMTWRGCVS